MPVNDTSRAHGTGQSQTLSKRIKMKPDHKVMTPFGKDFLIRYVVAFLFLLASFTGCQTGTDQGTLQSLDSLNQFQVAFIDTYTAAPGKQWDEAKLESDIATGEAMFTKAMAGVSDQKRANALGILHRQFQKDYTFLETREKEGKPFFSVAAAQQKKLLIQQNYNLAKKGETLRA